MALAHSKRRFTGGKYSLRMISPGMPNIHPWRMGMKPPMMPRMTRNTPREIRKIFRGSKRSQFYHHPLSWDSTGIKYHYYPDDRFSEVLDLARVKH